MLFSVGSGRLQSESMSSSSPIADGTLVLGTEIDEGEFGRVYRGKWAAAMEGDARVGP